MLNYKFHPRHSTYVRGFHAYGAILFHVGYRYQYAGSIYGINFYPREGALGVEFKNRYLDFSIASKPFDYKDSEVIEFELGVSIPLL